MFDCLFHKTKELESAVAKQVLVNVLGCLATGKEKLVVIYH